MNQVPDTEPCTYCREAPIQETEIKVPYCQLKQHDDESRVQVYEALARLGLEPKVPNEFCPVAVERKWTLCPFYESPAA